MTPRQLTALKASDPKMARLIGATEPVDTRAWRRARPLGDPFSVLGYSIIGLKSRDSPPGRSPVG